MNKNKFKELILKDEINNIKIIETYRHNHTMSDTEESWNIVNYKDTIEKQCISKVMYNVGIKIDKLEDVPTILFDKEWKDVENGEELNIEVILCVIDCKL